MRKEEEKKVIETVELVCRIGLIGCTALGLVEGFAEMLTKKLPKEEK